MSETLYTVAIETPHLTDRTMREQKFTGLSYPVALIIATTVLGDTDKACGVMHEAMSRGRAYADHHDGWDMKTVFVHRH